MKGPNANIKKQTLAQEDPLDGLRTDGKYEHLLLILSKNSNCIIGQEYLVVSPLGFGVYQLLDIDYQEDRIMMTLRNTDTNDIVEERLEVTDNKPQLFLLCWADIKKLVYKSKASDPSNTDLLEFDY